MRQIKVDISIKFSIAACIFGVAAILNILVR